jgi:glycosyltransferase involved in cell wall biosynthesis
VVPVYDEADNVVAMLDEIAATLLPLGPIEVLLVDDGSRDRSAELAAEWKRARAADWLRILRLARNRGQSAAVMAGAELARAPILLVMDGDLQNDPRDFARMLEMVESGRCDAVVGVRARRRDPWVRRWSSRIGNFVRNAITRDRVRDAACGIKVFRRDLFLRVPRFQGMHRFMATLARISGGSVVEVEVGHRPRIGGVAKYGIGNRAWRGLVDCFVVRWYRARVLGYEIREEL